MLQTTPHLMILKLKIHALCTTLDNTKLTTTRASLTLTLPLGESHTELCFLIGLSFSVKSEIYYTYDNYINRQWTVHMYMCVHIQQRAVAYGLVSALSLFKLHDSCAKSTQKKTFAVPLYVYTCSIYCGVMLT